MSESVLPKVNKARAKGGPARVIPGFGLTMGITVTMLSLLIIIPLLSVLGYSVSLGPEGFWQVITRPNVLKAFWTSVSCSLLAAAVNCVFGLILAWVLTRYDFPGRRLVDGLIELPFALPTAVAGITLSKMYSSTGVVGGLIYKLTGYQVSYTKLGLTIALVFVGIPFVVRALQPVLESLDRQYEEAAVILGAGRWRTFRKVILPELTPALLTGFGLALARGLGEYGSVIYISGNSEKNGTQVVSYVIMQKLNSGNVDYAGATAIALVLLIVSFLLLLLVTLMQNRAARRTSR